MLSAQEGAWLIGGVIVVQTLLFWAGVLLVERGDARNVGSVLWSTAALLLLSPATWLVLFALVTLPISLPVDPPLRRLATRLPIHPPSEKTNSRKLL